MFENIKKKLKSRKGNSLRIFKLQRMMQLKRKPQPKVWTSWRQKKKRLSAYR